MNKFILFAALFAVALAQSQLSLGGSTQGSLVANDNYDLIYLDYPENTSVVIFSLTSSAVPTFSCTGIYLFVSVLGFPCSDEPVDQVDNESGDPCYTSDYEYQYSSSSSAGVFYFSPGFYDDFNGIGNLVAPAGGRLFIQVAKDYSSDQCAYSLSNTFESCPSALNANNGISVLNTYNSDLTASSNQSHSCNVYSNITFVSNGPSTSNFNTSGVYVYKTMIPVNTAYVNITVSGALTGSTSYVEVYAGTGAPSTSSNSYINCEASFYPDSGSTSGSTTFQCDNTPAGAFYIVIETPSSSYFNGNLTINSRVCAAGTAAIENQLDNCTAARFFDASVLLTSTGVVNLTNVPYGETRVGYIDITTAFVGSSVTLNYTGTLEGTSTSQGYFYVSRTMIIDNSNYFSTYSQYDGFSLNSQFDTNQYSSLIGQRLYIAFKCDDSTVGYCNTQIVASGAVVTTTSTTSGNTTATSGVVTGGASVTTAVRVTTAVTVATPTTGLQATTGVRMTTGVTNSTGNTSTTTGSSASTSGSASDSSVLIPSFAVAFATIFAALL